VALTIELADGRTVSFKRAAATGAAHDDDRSGTPDDEDIVAAKFDEYSAHSVRPRSQPDLLVLQAGGDNPRVLVIQFKSDLRKLAPRDLNLNRLRQELALPTEAAGLEIKRQVWRTDFSHNRLWVYDLTPNGTVVEPATLYRISGVRSSTTPFGEAAEAKDEEREINSGYISRRLDDWETRIAALYQRIEDWLRDIDAQNLRSRIDGTVFMHEELMQKFAVPPRRIRILIVTRSGRTVLTFKPYGLWVIGANGRIDVIAHNSTALLLDAARAFHPARWQIQTRQDILRGKSPLQGRPFDQTALRALLSGE
jgi:hypothetical protein